jgi:sugar phosphate isomerase/epimerase
MHTKIFILLVALSLGVPVISAAEDFRFGLVAYHVPFDSYKLIEEDFDRIAGNGIDWISVDFAWRDIEKERGSYDFSYFDYVVENADKRGIMVLAKVGNGYNGNRAVVPEWTKSLSNEDYNRALGAYALAVAERYGDRIEYYAIENEPNVANMHILSGWRVGEWGDERIISVLRTLEQSIRKGDKDCKIVLSASVAPGWMDWIRRVKEEVNFDVIGLQPYPCIIFPDPNNAFNIMPDIEKAKSFGKEVMIIETGYHTFQRSEEAQAEYIENICAAAMKAGATGVSFYEYRDNSEEYPEQEKHFGLLKEDREPKLAWNRYGDLIKNPDVLKEKDVKVSTMGRLSSDLFNRGIVYRPFNLLIRLLLRSDILRSVFNRIANSDMTYRLIDLIG